MSSELAQPVIFIRESEKFNPKLLVCYFFKKSDSLVQRIEYEWDEQNFRSLNYQVSCIDVNRREDFDLFIGKYTELRNYISKIFGNGKSDGTIESKTGVSYLECKSSSSWENDSLSVYLYMVFSNRCEDHGAIKIFPTHRIRLNVSLKSDYNGMSGQLKTVFKSGDRQQGIAENYLDLLLKEKYEESGI